MKKLYLNDFHEQAGANYVKIQEWEIPGDYGDVKSELEAIKNNVSLLDRSYLGKLALTGTDTIDLLNRISTNDLQTLAVGTMADTVFATPKGRLIDYCKVLNTGDALLLIASFFRVIHLRDWINRFIIFEDVRVKDVTMEFSWLTLIGPHSRQFLGQLCNRPLNDTDEALWLDIEDKQFPVLRNENFKYPAYNICINNSDAVKMITILHDQLNSFNGQLIGDTAFQIIRVDSGMPDGGTEITQDYNPLEAYLTSAISFTKGCYTGQEVIARLDTYDKVQKYLMIIELSEKLSRQPPMEIFIDDEPIGHLTSYVHNPVTEQSLALGYIRKMYTTQNDIYVEILSGKTRIPGRLRIPPQAYV
jgi:folate-binding protein YgfZ